MVKIKNIVLLAKALVAGYLAYNFLYDHSFVEALVSQHHYTLRTAQLVDYYGRVGLLFIATLLYLPKLYTARIALTLLFFAFEWYSRSTKIIPPPSTYLNYAFYVFAFVLTMDFFVRYAKNDFGVELMAYSPLGQQPERQPQQEQPQTQQPYVNAYGQQNSVSPYGETNGIPPGIVIPDSAMGDMSSPISGMDDIFSSGGNESPEELELMDEMRKPPEEWRIVGGKFMNPKNMLCSQNYVLTERIFNEIA